MKILSAQWSDREHKKGWAYTELDGKKVYYYFCEEDKAPVNIEILQQIKSKKVEVMNNPYFDYIDGIQPPPKGMAVVDGQLMDEDQAAYLFREKADARLDELYKGRILAQVDNDEIYAENWRKRVKNLLKAKQMKPCECCRLDIKKVEEGEGDEPDNDTTC